MKSFTPTLDPCFYESESNAGLNLVQCLNEMIANSIDSWIDTWPNRRPELVINIKIATDGIEISDNAGGMDEAETEHSVGLGVTDKPNKDQELLMGMFGRGLCVAASTLGHHWEISSKKKNTDKAFKAIVPVTEQCLKGEWGTKIGDDLEFPSEIKHGTIVKIVPIRESIINEIDDTNLENHKIELERSWKYLIGKSNIGKIKIILNNLELKPFENPSLIERTTITTNLEVQYEEGNETVTKKVPFTFAVGKIGGQNAMAGGISIYRKKQLVKKLDRRLYTWGAETARLYGEIHLDFVPRNNDASDINDLDIGFKSTKESVEIFIRERIANLIKTPFLTAKMIKSRDPKIMNKWVAQWREEFIEELKLAGEGLSKEEKEALEEEPTVDDGPGGGTDDGPGGGTDDGPGGGTDDGPGEEDLKKNFRVVSEMKFSIDEEEYEIIFSPGEDASDGQLWDYDPGDSEDKQLIVYTKKPSRDKELLNLIIETRTSTSKFAKLSKNLIIYENLKSFLYEVKNFSLDEAQDAASKWLYATVK